MRAKKYSLNTINGTIELDIAGGYWKLMSATTAIGVELLASGNQALLAESIDAGFYQRIRFDKIRITDTGAQAITFLVAPDEGGSDRFTGAFSLTGFAALNPEDARYFLFGDDETLDGEAFHGTAPAGPVAAQVSLVQLWNPVGSGKLAYVDQFEFTNLAATSRFELRQNAAALGAVIGQFPKKIGGGASVMELRGGTSAAPGGTVIRNYAAIVNEMVSVRLGAPISVPEGNGVMIVGFTVNQLIIGNFDWREKLT